jgi:hypothetical protein
MPAKSAAVLLRNLEICGLIRACGGWTTTYDCEALSIHDHAATGARE